MKTNIITTKHIASQGYANSILKTKFKNKQKVWKHPSCWCDLV